MSASELQFAHSHGFSNLLQITDCDTRKASYYFRIEGKRVGPLKAEDWQSLSKVRARVLDAHAINVPLLSAKQWAIVTGALTEGMKRVALVRGLGEDGRRRGYISFERFTEIVNSADGARERFAAFEAELDKQEKEND